MGAKEMFEELGYKQEIYNSEDGNKIPGIRYSKEIVVISAKNEILKNRINPIRYIEFYTLSKDMMLGREGQFGDEESENDIAFLLNLDEQKAIIAQIMELGW